MQENDLARIVVDKAYKIHTWSGPGLLESTYERILEFELKREALHVLRQHPIPIVYEGITLDEGYKADLIVNDLLIVELKATEKHDPLFQRQLLTYLKLADKRLGLLINFGQALIKDGIKRVANDMPRF